MQFSKDQWNLLLSKNIGRKPGEITALWQSVVTDMLSFISFLTAFDLSSAHFSRSLKYLAAKFFYLKTRNNFI